MKPWHTCEFQLEEMFEKIVLLYNNNPNTDIGEVGQCLVTLITLCQDIDLIHEQLEQKKFWLSIEEDVHQLLLYTSDFLKNYL